jgi:phospholipid/cholesterol/gamma-HCH transport system substrate-binding protein
VRQQRSVRVSALAVATFTALSLVTVLVIAATVRPFAWGGDQVTYSAVFSSASRIGAGDQVMVGGVRVGQVTGVELTSEAAALVSFQVERDLPVSTATRAELRYLDLVGGRYLALVEPPRDAGEERTRPRQSPDSPIPRSRTSPALDLNALLNGFKPLFSALDPEDVNALATDIVRTFQGEGMTVRQLIASTGSLTSGLARRDEVIDALLTDLGRTVTTVAGHHDQLEGLIRDLSVFAVGLARDRRAIGDSLRHINTMTALSAGLLRDARPSLRRDIADLRAIARALSTGDGRREVEHALDHLPRKLQRLSRTAAYGSWFNYYVCSVKVRVDSTSRLDPAVRRLLDRIALNDSAKRCDP